MSISVALHEEISIHQCHRQTNMAPLMDVVEVERCKAHQAIHNSSRQPPSVFQRRAAKRHSIPEQTEEPIINSLEEAHGAEQRERTLLALSRSSESRAAEWEEEGLRRRNGPRARYP